MINHTPSRPLIVVDQEMLDDFRKSLLADLLVSLEERAKERVKEDRRIERHAAAKRLSKHPDTLSRYEKVGLLTPIKIGRTVYYAESEIVNLEGGHHGNR